MLLSRKNAADWDLKNELNKVNVRWALLILVSCYLISQYFLLIEDDSGQRNISRLFYILNLSAAVLILNMIYNFYLFSVRKKSGLIHSSLKYISMIFDLSVITLLLIPTGGSESMFFILYIVVLLSNGMRYGMRLAMTGVLSFNVMYFIMLFYLNYPRTEIQEFQREILKVTGIWIVGLYIGYLARRFEMLHEEVDKYKALLVRYMKNEDDVKSPGETENGR